MADNVSQSEQSDSLGCGLIDQAMIERAARALCDLDNDRMGVHLEYENWRSDYDEKARLALNAALYGGSRS